VGAAYSFQVVATGTPAPTFSATGLPTGLSINPTTGLISGTPTTANTFAGSIKAANGVGTDATQAFSITISAAPAVNISSARVEGSSLVLSGTGPANSTYTVVSSKDLSTPVAQWPSAGSGTIDSTGHFTATVPIGTSTQMFTRVRVP
jgi:hypothetical protein